VRKGLEEREESDHSSKSNQAADSRYASERCDRKSDKEEAERPVAGEFDDLIERIGAEPIRQS
jgi:hypothetical protein